MIILTIYVDTIYNVDTERISAATIIKVYEFFCCFEKLYSNRFT